MLYANRKGTDQTAHVIRAFSVRQCSLRTQFVLLARKSGLDKTEKMSRLILPFVSKNDTRVILLYTRFTDFSSR